MYQCSWRILGSKESGIKEKKIKLLGVPDLGVSFKPFTPLPFLLAKEEKLKKNDLFWPAWSMAPFALEGRETLICSSKKINPPKLLGEKFPDTFSQLLLEESGVLWGAARIFASG